MKRLIIVLLLMFAAVPVFAEMDGKCYTATINGVEYTLTFSQGPFGPGETGTVLLEDQNGAEVTLTYRIFDGRGTIDKFPFIWGPDGTLTIFIETVDFFPKAE